MSEEIVSFGAWLQQRREHLGLTRKQLAQKVGCSPVTIKKIERDERRPSVQIAELLADSLQIPVTEQAHFIRRARGEFVPHFDLPHEMSLLGTEMSGEPSHKLPNQPTPFIGRQAELAALRDLLTRPEVELVTIVGPGGIGKTRLSLAVARDQQATGLLADGVYYVPLAPLSDVKDLVSAISDVLDIQPSGNQSLYRMLLAYLRTRQVLLVLDNFEHLLAGVDLVADVLVTAPQVKLLVTSRERLELQQEWVYELRGLTYPTELDAGTETTFSGIELFVQRAQKGRTDFVLSAENRPHVIEICQLVKGMPLALELAAAWIPTMSCADIAAEIKESLDFLASELRNVPERHQSVRAVFSGSWQRLGESERPAFAQLSVFRGGFTRQAAQAVAEIPLRQLSRLVSKSLLTYDAQHKRYEIHELLRQFGAEKLSQFGQADQVRDRHLAFFLELAEEANPHLESDIDQISWLRRLELEHSNLREALAWSQTGPDKEESALRLAGALRYFWAMRGYDDEARTIYAALLSNRTPSANLAACAKLLHGAALMAIEQGDFSAARPLLEENLTNSHELGSAGRASLADTLVLFGVLESEEGDYEAAVTRYEEALEVLRNLDDSFRLARALRHRGIVELRQSHLEAASRYFSDALSLIRQIGSQEQLGHLLQHMGEVALRRQDFSQAEALTLECLALWRGLGYKFGIARVQGNLAWVALRLGEPRRALISLKESLLLRREIGDVTGGTAWCLEKMAEVAAHLAQQDSYRQKDQALRQAAQLYGAAHALRTSTGAEMDLADRPLYERQVAHIRTTLSEPVFIAAWAEGQYIDFVELADSLIAELEDSL